MAESDERYLFKKQLRELKKYRGSGTELISVYIPAGSPIHETTNRLREELSQASNIKSKATRTNVLGALERIINHLKLYRKTPENGLAVFCGNVSDNPAKTDIKLFAIEPPEKLNIGAYRCDSTFFLEPLESILEAKDSYGIVVMDGREATLAIVKGTNIDIVKRIHSQAHAKIRKGGQSARRFERLIEEQIERYYKKVGEAMDEAFLGKVKGVIIGGPGPTKDFFMKMKPFNYQHKIIGIVDTGYTDEYGIREVLDKSGELLAKQEAIKEKKLVERFIKEIVHEGLATYGVKEVLEAITSKKAQTVLISEGLTQTLAKYKNERGEEVIKIMREKPPVSLEIKGKKYVLCESTPLLDAIVEKAREAGVEVEIISTNTVEGAQFLSGFGGIGAFLRYK